MATKKTKRQKVVKKMNLSEHTLDINIRRCNYEKFTFSEIEEYVLALTGSRDYQYDAIKQVMIYLWGGAYKSITDLAIENHQKKSQIQHRFGDENSVISILETTAEDGKKYKTKYYNLDSNSRGNASLFY
ncbi:MAG: hypothetical protein ACKVE4_04255 [Dissulfuribacterales bacterium]